MEEVQLLEETYDTGVIYKITNVINEKIYIGKAYSYITDRHKQRRYGLEGRYLKHKQCAFSNDPKREKECPELYEDMRFYGEEAFEEQNYNALKYIERTVRDVFNSDILNIEANDELEDYLVELGDYLKETK